MALSRAVRLLAAVAATVSLAACGSSPAEPEPELELAITGGDRQFGVANRRLDAPLEVVVRRVDSGEGESGALVTWSVQRGAASLEDASGTTDTEGRARVTVTLGDGTDTVRVRASIQAHPEAAATFEAYVIDHPQVAALSREVARGGDTLVLTGRGFSADPSSNVVLFSGIRARVLSASSEELRVEVPRCLPGRTVGVSTQLGAVRSEPLPLRVEDVGSFTHLERGEYIDVDESEEVRCIRLEGGGANYLVMPYAAGTTGAARYDFVLTGLGGGGPGAGVGAHAGAPSHPSVPGAAAQAADVPFPARWEGSLRAEEARLVRNGVLRARAVAPTPGAPASAPEVGQRRTFSVLNADGGFDQVTAVARVVGTQAVLYVDETAPTGGLEDADLEAFAATFDDVIYPTDTEAFGQPSDLDGNGHVAILFTPTVNGLTPRGSEGFVGGFFYGLDLLDRAGSNHGEVFYAVVPDPEGTYSDPRGKGKILQVVPAILAHEFQHMIHFNERVLKLGAERTEALWLSEGLAQMAEELVARAFSRRGNLLTAKHFRDGNDDRARRWLAATDAHSLIVATGQGSLEERGAGWLFTLWLWDLDDRGELLARLTRTTRTGTENVAAVTGHPWKRVLADWGAALYLDGLPIPGLPFGYPTIDLKARLSGPDPFPLTPELLLDEDFTRTGSLWSSSLKHYIGVPPSDGGTVLRLGGAAGGNAPAEAGLRLRVLRVF